MVVALKKINIKPTADFERNSEQRIEKMLSNLLEQASLSTVGHKLHISENY